VHHSPASEWVLPTHQVDVPAWGPTQSKPWVLFGSGISGEGAQGQRTDGSGLESEMSRKSTLRRPPELAGFAKC
jgi:hypothetical protein